MEEQPLIHDPTGYSKPKDTPTKALAEQVTGTAPATDTVPVTGTASHGGPLKEEKAKDEGRRQKGR